MEMDPGDFQPADATPADYSPPQVERVMDADELGREVLYAGRPGISQ